MPRRALPILARVPLHITQRGVDRCHTFLAAEDFAFYRWALGEARFAADCAVHAYALMTNHVHLLVTPADAEGPVRMMRSLGRRYVRYFNDRYRRTGTLGEGRYRAARIDSAPYLFACSRYIELNPVRAAIVADPSSYLWSSYRHNACGDDDSLVSPHPQYVALGMSRDARCAAYRALFATDVEPGVVATLRASLRGRPKLHPSPYRQAIDAMEQSMSGGTCSA
jgi:putative transposase